MRLAEPPAWRWLIPAASAFLIFPALGGCFAAVLAGKAASTTIGVAADVTAATVRGTGKVVAAAVGNGADESVRVAAKHSKTGMVVFFEARTGTTWAAPWREGLTVLDAAETARFDLALTAVRVIRAGKVLTAGSAIADLPVKSGDVVELARGV